MRLGPAALRTYTRLRARVTSEMETEIELTSILYHREQVRSPWWQCLSGSKLVKNVFRLSGREAGVFTEIFVFFLKSMMLLIPCHRPLVSVELTCDSTLILYWRLAALIVFRGR